MLNVGRLEVARILLLGNVAHLWNHIDAFEVILGNVLALTMVLGVIVGVMRARNAVKSEPISS